MGNQSLAPAEHDDVALAESIDAHAINDERVSGPDCGQHTPALGAQAQTGGREQYFACQLALEGLQIMRLRLRTTVHDALA